MPLDAFTVDVLTSVSKVFSDLPCQWYRWIHGWPLDVLPWHDDLACFSRSIVFPLLIALPYALRLVQCIREWNWRSSVNAVKFATILLFLVFQALRSVDDARWQAAYLSTGIVSSLLSIGWNIYFDLEVTARWNDVVTLFFDLPMELLRWCFCVWFMLIDSVIRFNWCWKMLSPKRTWVAFLFSLLELFRRFHWIYFRLDREVQAAGPGLPQTAKASNIQLCGQTRDEPARCALDGPLALTRSSSCPLPRASRFSEQWG